jgi:hypothetical protein
MKYETQTIEKDSFDFTLKKEADALIICVGVIDSSNFLTEFEIWGKPNEQCNLLFYTIQMFIKNLSETTGMPIGEVKDLVREIANKALSEVKEETVEEKAYH